MNGSDFEGLTDEQLESMEEFSSSEESYENISDKTSEGDFSSSDKFNSESDFSGIELSRTEAELSALGLSVDSKLHRGPFSVLKKKLIPLCIFMNTLPKEEKL